MREPRDVAAAGVMADALREALALDPSLAGRTLISALDETGRVAEAAASLDLPCTSWHRFQVPGAVATAWPPEGSFGLGALRLPKGREALDMSVHAMLARLEPGARLFVYGANDEGVRSLGPRLEVWLEELRTLSTRRHSRVWSGRVPEAASSSRGELEAWQEEVVLDAPGGPLTLHSAPGLFAHGRLDAGTRMLLETLAALPRVKPGGVTLDYGCGAGTVTLWLARNMERGEHHGVDRDALAIHMAALNLPDAHWHLGDGWSGVPAETPFDLVASNPPLHEGKDQELGHLGALIEGAGRRLARRGRLLFVTQRPLPVGPMLRERFAEVEVARENRSYRVWSARGRV